MAEKKGDRDNQIRMLERGNIYFFYRPRVEEEEPEGSRDVQRLYMVLSPDDKKQYRLAIVGRKKLPAPSGSGRFWGFIGKIARSPKSIGRDLQAHGYQTKTRGERHEPAARPSGEGVYRILRHGNHTHLAYALELPQHPGGVQEELRLEDEASYIISIKNPAKGGPRVAGLSAEKQPDYPQYLKDTFHGRKFSEADPPNFLDHAGTEFLMISASDDVEEELGIKLHPQHESQSSADIFRDLKLDKSKHPLEPLFQGDWD